MTDTSKFGPAFKDKGLWVAPEQGPWRHRFGGASWRVVDPDPLCDGPSLLFVLDLADPSLVALRTPGLDELPLCSYVNSLVWEGRQRFHLSGAEHTANMLKRESASRECLDEADRYPNPLNERPISLIPMTDEGLPLDEERYWSACDDFVGGTRFARILGAPLWLEQPHEEVCRCGRAMLHVAAVGYESLDHPSGLVPGRPFFIGEGALYFFWCPKCLDVSVVSQST
jgi:hypothetical protein